ncbi:unnamed protein product [marine sediment metagenome]|uniref:Uncharacterized protein n=1 Tax=marine sediment metagenome TaxID=412755 RepID=X1KIG6_9ZZZZ
MYGTQEIHTKMQSFMNKFSKKFETIFEEMLINHFMDKLLYSCGIISFDIILFDKYLKKNIQNILMEV